MEFRIVGSESGNVVGLSGFTGFFGGVLYFFSRCVCLRVCVFGSICIFISAYDIYVSVGLISCVS